MRTPAVRGGSGARLRQCDVPVTLDRLEPTCASVSGIETGSFGDVRPEAAGFDQAFQLELLLGIPIVRCVGLKRADNAARRPRAGAVWIDHAHARAALQSLPRDGKSEDARAPDRQIGHCQVGLLSTLCLNDFKVFIGQRVQGDQSPELEWKDGVPVARAFDDPYFSLENGLAETRYVFLDGNGLPGRFCPGFQIAELGFGTGLNALACLDLWRKSGHEGQLRYTAFELYPMAAEDMARALEAFPEMHATAAALIEARGAGRLSLELPDVSLEIIAGDARKTLPRWAGLADAWFLDGFAPAKNPELWEPRLMQNVARHTRPGGTAATYTAAGAVRRALDEAGFDVSRRPGFGRKRHMTVARRK